ncbi:hypothetical protein P9112_003229 [Eukaryota sp. TZLM1-RC]
MISDSNSNSDDLIVINNSELTLTTVDFSNTKFSNIIDTQTSTITITDFDIVHHESNTGSFINADDSTLDFTNVKTLGPVDSDGKVIVGCANDEPLITLVKSNVDFDDVVVVGCQSQSIVATDSTIDLETVLVRDSTASDGHFELTKTTLTMNNANFQGLEGKVFNIKDTTKVVGTNVGISDSNSNSDDLIVIDNSDLTLTTVDLSYTKFSNIIDTKTSTITITDFDIVHHESNTGSFINADDSTLDFTNVKTLGPVDSDGKVISGCANDEPLITLVKSNVDFDDVVVVGCQSQSIVATDSTIDLETVLVRDSKASGHVELTNSDFKATNVEFKNLEGKVFDVKSGSQVEGSNVKVIDTTTNNDPMMVTDSSTIDFKQTEIINSCVRPAFESIDSTVKIDDLKVSHPNTYSGSLFDVSSASELTLDNINIVKESSTSTTVTCSFTDPLFTVDNSEVTLADSSLIGHLSQTLVGINNADVTFTNVDVLDSQSSGHVELTNSDFKATNVKFKNLEGKVFDVKSDSVFDGLCVQLLNIDTPSEAILKTSFSKITLVDSKILDSSVFRLIDSISSGETTLTNFDIINLTSYSGSFINADDSTLDFTNVKSLGPVDSDGNVISGCANDEPLITLVKSNVDFDDVVVVGCQSQSIVATDSTIDLETVLVRDSKASGHVELTNSDFKATDVEFKNLEGKVFDVKSGSQVEGLNVKVIDTTTNNDPMMVTDSSTIDFKQTEIINSCVRPAFESIDSTIKIDDLKVSHPNTYSGSLFDVSSASELTLDNINIVKESSTSTTVTCSFTDPLFTVDNSEVTLADSSLIGHLSQTLVGINNADVTFTNVDVLDSQASGHVELANSDFKATNFKFKNLEGKVFDVKSGSQVEGLNVKVIDTTTNNDPMMVTDSSTIDFKQTEIINSCVRPAFESIDSTIKIDDLKVSHPNTYSGSLFDVSSASELTLDNINIVKESSTSTTVTCSFTDPLFTVDNSAVTLADSSLIGHLSQTLVGINNADVTFTNVDVLDSQASGHVELANSDFKATDVEFKNLEGKVFDVKSDSDFNGLRVQLLNIDTPSEALLKTSFSKITLVDSKILDSSVFRLIDSISSGETTLTNFDIINLTSYSGSFINADDSTLDFTNVKTLGPVDSDGKVISGCANDEPLITLVKSNVDFDDVVVVGCQSQSIVATDSTIDLETVLVRDSTATDGHFELTKTNLTMNNANFQGLEGKVFNIKDTTKVTGTNVGISYSNSNSDDLIVINNSELTLTTVDLSDTKFSNIIDSKTSTITITDFDIVHHESNTGSFIDADDSTLDFTNVKTLGPVDSDGKVISGCANDEPLITLVKSNVDFDDVVVVGCQSQSIVATDSTIDVETVLVRDSTASDGHFELTKTTLTMNNANFQGLEGKVFNIKDTTKVTGTNVDISDSNSNSDDLIVIDNSDLTLTTVDLSNTKFSNIIDTKTSTITITDFDIVHHESNTGSFINADDSTLYFTNVKTLGPVDSDGNVISGCANDEPLITLVKSNVDFDDVVVVGCQSQSIVATDSTIDLETVLVRDSTATDGHFELTKTTLTMNNANFQGLEGKVFNIKDTTKVTGTNVDISDSNSNSDDLIVIDNSDLTLTTVDLSNTKFSNIIDTKTSTITISDFDIVHHESNTGSFINADDSTLDFTNVKTLGPVDSDGNVISGCANDEPLITLVKSNVDFDDVVVVGCQSQSIVATDSTIDLETVLVRDSTATDGHFELTKTTLTMNNANFQGLEGKVFNIKDTTKITGTNVDISDSNSNSDDLIVIDNSDLTLTTVDLSNTKFSNIIDTKTSTITITDFDIVHHESNTGSFINADDSTLDFTNVKTLGPVDSDGNVISGCANDEPLITLVKSNVDFGDVVVVGCQSQSIVATDSTIDLETVLVRDSTATDGHFELTKTTLTMNNTNFERLDGHQLFYIQSNSIIMSSNLMFNSINSNSFSFISMFESEFYLVDSLIENTTAKHVVEAKESELSFTNLTINDSVFTDEAFSLVQSIVGEFSYFVNHHFKATNMVVLQDQSFVKLLNYIVSPHVNYRNSLVIAKDSIVELENFLALGKVYSETGSLIQDCTNLGPILFLTRTDLKMNNVDLVGCTAQSLVADDSRINFENVTFRDGVVQGGHVKLTQTVLEGNSLVINNLVGKIFDIEQNSEGILVNVDISDSNSNSDDLIVINNSDLTLTNVDLSNTKFSNIIESESSTITITDFDIVHHESNTGSFINADDSTLDFTNVKTLGPVDSDGKVISGCANDEPLITLVKSNVDFYDVVVVGCQSQSIVATDSTIDLETVLVRDSTATDGHFELTKTTLTMNNANFQGLEGKVFNIKDTAKVTGTNVDISDSNSNSDDLIVINNSDLTLTNVDLSDTKFSNIIDTKTSTITITDFDIVHHESNTGSFINADDSTLDFIKVKTLGPVDSDGKVISGCANDEPLMTLVKSNVDFDDVVVVGCQSQSIVATDSTIDLETVLVRDSTATDGHFELTKTTLTMNNANFQGLEGKVINIKDTTKVTGTNVDISDSNSNFDDLFVINNSELTLTTVDLSDTKFSNIIDTKTSTITITDFDIVHHESNTGSFINADDSTLDFTNVKTLGPVDSDGKVISGCANDEPLITLVKSNVDFDDVVVVGCQSQSIVATDSTIDLETVLVRDSTATDGHFELTKTTLTMNNANFQGLEGKVFNIKDTAKVTGTNVDISDSNSNSDDLIVINNSDLTLTNVDLSDTKFSNIIDTKTSTITITDF